MGELLEDHLPHNENNSTINLLGSMDKNSAIVVSALIAFLGVLPSAALSHGGGTDSSGCHRDSKTGTTHCHSSKGASGGTSAQPSAIYFPEECKDEFGLSKLLSQASTGYVRAQCGRSFLLIDTRKYRG